MFSKKYSNLLFILVMGFGMSLLMTLIITYVNTGMDSNGKRFELGYTRHCIKEAIDSNTPSIDTSMEVADILSSVL